MAKNNLKTNRDASSKFALNNSLDDRYNKRTKVYANAKEDIQKAMKSVLDKYVDGDIVTSYSLEEFLIRELLLDYRDREGY